MKNQKIAAVVTAIMFSFIASNASAKIEQFSLKGAAPSGSKIRAVEAVSPVPFNKPFAELTSEQRAQVAGWFDALPSDSTPPFPTQGIQAVYKPLLAKNKSLASSGKLVLSALVNKNGFVERVTVIESSSPALSRYAEKVLQRTHFDPAVCGSETCAMEFPVSLQVH